MPTFGTCRCVRYLGSGQMAANGCLYNKRTLFICALKFGMKEALDTSVSRKRSEEPFLQSFSGVGGFANSRDSWSIHLVYFLPNKILAYRVVWLAANPSWDPLFGTPCPPWWPLPFPHHLSLPPSTSSLPPEDPLEHLLWQLPVYKASTRTNIVMGGSLNLCLFENHESDCLSK